MREVKTQNVTFQSAYVYIFICRVEKKRHDEQRQLTRIIDKILESGGFFENQHFNAMFWISEDLQHIVYSDESFFQIEYLL